MPSASLGFEMPGWHSSALSAGFSLDMSATSNRWRDLRTMSSSVQIIEALNRSSFTRQHLAFYLTIVFCHFFDGFDIQMMGFTLPGIVGEFKLTPGQAGFLASSVFSGMLLGGIVVGTLADSIGRKNAL